MRRVFFLAITVILIELFTYIGAKGVFWLVKPYLPQAKTAVFVAMFVITHLFLITLFIGQFRFGMGYMALLWLGVLTVFGTWLVLTALQSANIKPNPAIMRVFAVGGFVGLVSLAVYNAYTPVVRHLSITVDKPVSPLRIAVASDTHLGYMVGARQLNRLADILKQEKADLLLMPGDIMDDDTHVYRGEKMHIAFDNLVSSVNGNLIASLGNHDLYKEKERQAIVKAVRDSGAILLDDATQTFTINGTPMTIIGRYDDHHTQRKSTGELLAGVDTSNLVILLDHRPSEIDENVKHSIDLQVSGHTHNGQVFPANFIVKMLNRVAYGHELINGTHVVVSSGYGFWGIPFRLGSQSEVWLIDMTGRDDKSITK